MAITKRNLEERIKRRLGYPMIKVELDPTQIWDAIDYARDKWVRWAVGQSTQEVYFTIALSAGQTIYDLPVGVTEVVQYEDDKLSSGSVNTLFTMENYLFYNTGWGATLINMGSGTDYDGDEYSLVSFHIARDFLETLQRYTPPSYNYKYHRYQNQLEIQPAPPSGNYLQFEQDGEVYTIDSPGWLLLRTYMIEGSTNVSGWDWGSSDEDFYTSDWIFDYALAECKIMLGRIRNKFANFASIGNQGLSMDGAELMAEGKEEKQYLEETLRLEEVYDGYGIEIG